jgi:hypothetical protein
VVGMLYRALDVIFQLLFRLIAALVLVPLVAGGVGLALDHSSSVEARIWADKPIFTPEFATDRFTSTDSPADIEAGILRELVGTSQFTTEVLTAVDFQYPNWSSDQQTAAEADLQANVTVTTEGSHLFTLDYKTPNTDRGRKIVDAVIAAFGRQVQSLDTTQVSVTQTALQGQVDASYRDMTTAVQQAQTYLAQHQSGVDNDPTYQTLIATAQSKTDSYLALQAQLDEVKGSQTAVFTLQSSFFHVVDQPYVVPLKIDQHLPAVKYLAFALVGVLAGEALLVYVIARRDPRIRAVQDIRRVGKFRPLGSTPASIKAP